MSKITDLNRANRLFDISRKLKDDFCKRTLNYSSGKEFIHFQINYHSACLRAYENKNLEKKLKTDVSHFVEKTIVDVIKDLENNIKAGKVFSLSDVAELLKSESVPDSCLKYENIKSCLIKHFGEAISFVKPSQRNKSQLFFYTDSLALIVEQSYKHDCVANSANILKNSLKNIDFKLRNKFCDEHDLRTSWEDFVIPEVFKTFLCTFLDVKKEEIDKKIDYIDDLKESDLKSNLHLLKLKVVFQILYYIRYKGMRKTPWHVNLGLQIWSTTKSKTLVTLLNHCGLSICYDENLRIRTRLAEYAKETSASGSILPSHFDHESFVTAAFDNLDIRDWGTSGTKSVHDTKIVLFQEYDATLKRKKPDLSEVIESPNKRTFSSMLKCQELKSYTKTSTTINIPQKFEYRLSDINISDYYNITQKIDFAWLISRMNITDSEILEMNENQNTPSWRAFMSLLLEDHRKKDRVAYLPVIPYPITEYATVYTCMVLFVDLLKQLKQKYLFVSCDYGVYHIARHIKFEHPELFKFIILILGGFHTIKVIQGCIGKYLKQSGAEEIFNQTRLFGANTVEQVLSGSDYNRSMKGLSYIYEALTRLQLKSFFVPEKMDKYFNEINSLILLKDSIVSGNTMEAKLELNTFIENCSEMLSDFHAFVEDGCRKSQLFKYWNNVLIMICLMQDFVRADRTGDGLLHIETFKKALPIFNIMDRVNYTRWGPVYLNDILELEKTLPEAYDHFIKGRFTVKHTMASFSSVNADQALEQTINKSSKSIAGIKGMSQNKSSIAAWELTYHELLGISNFFKDLTFTQEIREDHLLHHEYTSTKTSQSEEPIKKILTFLADRDINPFLLESQQLLNPVTGEAVHPEIATKILNVYETAIDSYNKLVRRKFINKIEPLTKTISENKFPSFKSIPRILQPKTKKDKERDIKFIQRYIALAEERKYPKDKLLTYDLVESNPLFDEDGYIKKEKNKSSLIRTIEEKSATLSDPNDSITFEKKDIDTCLILDVMLIIRKLTWTNLVTFEDLAKNFSRYVLDKCSLQKTKRIDFIFDSYFPNSPKSSEHFRRCKTQSIIFPKISDHTKLPKNNDKDDFWGSSSNKILLQHFLKNYVTLNADFDEFDIVFSTIDDFPCTALKRSVDSIKYLQRFDIEEADVKIMLHMQHAVSEGYENVYLISSDLM